MFSCLGSNSSLKFRLMKDIDQNGVLFNTVTSSSSLLKVNFIREKRGVFSSVPTFMEYKEHIRKGTSD